MALIRVDSIVTLLTSVSMARGIVPFVKVTCKKLSSIVNMTSNSSEEPAIKTQIQVKQLERWQIYERLQELQIPCRCHCNQPLEVELETPLKVWQFWSVVWRVSASRESLSGYLDHCWRLPSY